MEDRAWDAIYELRREVHGLGASLSEIESSLDRLRTWANREINRISSSYSDLHTRIEVAESQLDNKIENLNWSMRKMEDEIGESIKQMNVSLTAKLDEILLNINDRIDKLREKISLQLSKHHTSVEAVGKLLHITHSQIQVQQHKSERKASMEHEGVESGLNKLLDSLNEHILDLRSQFDQLLKLVENLEALIDEQKIIHAHKEDNL